jgi:hypothetical protein
MDQLTELLRQRVKAFGADYREHTKPRPGLSKAEQVMLAFEDKAPCTECGSPTDNRQLHAGRCEECVDFTRNWLKAHPA